ncbi:hypothetical protein OGZ51_13350 [Lactococcus lactis]|uniref:Uncharacterized protein n=1 Tax=Lactococcus lactis TaxID=1358 RepID=A0A9X4NVS5_9LACT|nr:hypothetical protein [Lactococcus lactis]MDG4985126.1 hypothetical protein [Lactococcus lactis]
MNSDEELVSFWSKVIFELGFMGFSFSYLIHLNELNRSLRVNVNVSNIFEVVTYNGSQPARYSILALFVIMIAVILVIWYYNTAKSFRFHPFFLLLTIVTFIVNTLITVWVWNLISQPILRAVML